MEETEDFDGFYAAVFAIGYYMMIRGNREVLQEMREERLSGGRPQVVIEASLLNLPTVELVVRNESGGAAKDITFDFTAPIEDSSGFVLSDLRYLKEKVAAARAIPQAAKPSSAAFSARP